MDKYVCAHTHTITKNQVMNSLKVAKDKIKEERAQTLAEVEEMKIMTRKVADENSALSKSLEERDRVISTKEIEVKKLENDIIKRENELHLQLLR